MEGYVLLYGVIFICISNSIWKRTEIQRKETSFGKPSSFWYHITCEALGISVSFTYIAFLYSLKTDALLFLPNYKMRKIPGSEVQKRKQQHGSQITLLKLLLLFGVVFASYFSKWVCVSHN
jgi:hypothetical protein